mmetsp:Transcript_7263/g.10807  ORF Transcript_7263/g.10807 Transcript_7263/m.10807 type:complete len:389 (-) Transcript_7263:369-1535(-)|eukprot:CAMPEP_0170061410 /NCGR_PEP_ID=MMETSP0019_2-20121128/2980_1 /TAXON_ID=98059 /ORGANISM="Dinobryon sp., Strain UTEXLB2267" /LENGTH=388 /DNA_ID=CAMNT_0010267217 /DNA_START=68 /DNA_END=1234 /DNA_ORIENTATION=-
MGGAPSLGKKASKGVKKFNQTYMLARELGSGAFSVVKLGIHLETGQKTAVKVVSKKKLSEEDYASLLTEIDILKHLDHPHIIKLYETFEEGNEFYIVTELVEGGELFDRIVSKAHYNEKSARDLVKLMLETIDYVHRSGFVHRDLKPENLLLMSEKDDSSIKIADFGFAKKISDLVARETACGTPGYVAPEILRGDKYGAEVDIWSMGVICYVLLAGYPPFYDEDQKRLFKKIKEGRYHFHEDYWSNTSPEAIDLIRSMLTVDQTKRWTASQLLQHPWIKMMDDSLLNHDLTGSIQVMRKFNARRRLRAAADAIITLNRMKGGVRRNKRVSLIDQEQVIASDYEVIEDDSKFMMNPRRAFEAEVDVVQKSVVFDPVKDLLNDDSLRDV